MTGRQRHGASWRTFVPGFLVCITCLLPLKGQELPDIPDLIRVTVDHSDGGVLIQWEASEDPDVAVYNLYKQTDDVFVFVATIPGSVLEFKHMSGGTENLLYAVTAVDSSGNESLFEQNVHRAVTASAEFEPCTPSNQLEWNAYVGWEGQVSGYRIYGGIQGGPLQMLGFVNASTLSYTHKGIVVDTVYAYYIETVNANGNTSLSAIVSSGSILPKAPELLTIDYVTVLDRMEVEVQFSADVSGQVNDFRLMKRSNPGTPYVEVTTIWDTDVPTHVVRDQFPTFNSSFEYLLEAIYQPGECSTPIPIAQSNPGSSILLVSSVQDQLVTLSWTPYATYPDGLSGYTVQRKGGSGEFIDIQNLGPGTNSWNETVQSVINGFQPGELQYRVLAIENQGEGGDPAVSISNIVSVEVESHLQLPTAFTPGSNDMNSQFKPVIDFAPREYVLIIMDRTGRKMFETTDPGAGWDGRFRNGEFVQEGVYVYYVQFTDYTGLYKSLTGTVTVLYP